MDWASGVIDQAMTGLQAHVGGDAPLLPAMGLLLALGMSLTRGGRR
jgi:hypothetical protein